MEASRLISRYIDKMLNVGVLFLATATLTTVCCNAQSKIGRTYIACESNDGVMLQLTRAHGGQITGVISVVQLDSSGKVKSNTSSIAGGTLDGAQLTLTLHSEIFGTNISGTMAGNTIRLQSVDGHGRVSSSTFTRGSVSEFSTCAGQLQQKSAVIALNANLASQVRKFSQTAHDAEAWIQNAQLHAARIPTAEGHYNQIQDEMQQLVERERRTSGSVDRSQISVDVNQKSIDGDQFDIDVNQTWEWPIEGHLKPINQQLAECATVCSLRGAEMPGTDPTIKVQWELSCRAILAEQSNFQAVAQKIIEQRSELKAYQAKAKSLRESTVKQAEKLAQ